jgi:hypothetical protein
VKTSPRLTVLVLATLALSASACRPPVFFPQFGVETGSDPINFAEDSAIQPDGEFVVTWRGFGAKDVYGRRFPAHLATRTPFAMNADTAPLREGASIDRDASGRYVIVWKENDADIWGQRWNADGTPIGGNFQINASTPGFLAPPRVASDPSGNFVVTWTSNADAVARRFDSNGAALGGEFIVNQYTTGSQYASAVAMSATGFVVTWSGADQDGDGPFARVFDASGVPITNEFRVNTSTYPGTVSGPDVAMDARGGFVVVWGDDPFMSQGVHGRRFESDGASLGDEFLIHGSTTQVVSKPRVASDSAGNFLVTWQENEAGNLDDSDVFGRFYRIDGHTASDPFVINEDTAVRHAHPRPSLADDGSFVVAFCSGSIDEYNVEGRKGGVRATPEIVMDPLPAVAVPAGDTIGNGVFEPGESQTLRTAWINESPEFVDGIVANGVLFTGPLGAAYSIDDDVAAYDVLPTGESKSCEETGDCYAVTVSDPITRPVQHWDALFQEQTTMSLPHTWVLHLGESFPDVPPANTFYRFIETLFHKEVTGGCAGGGYCPGNPVTRAQMAVFLLKAKFGSAHVPPPCTGQVFGDVPCAGGPFDPWIEELASLQITGGCGPGLYCPGNTVTRQQMAVFLLKAFEGSSYDPPDCTGVFDDVPCTPGTGFSDWIEELAARGVTGGCSVSPPLFCPTNPNNRGQMAAFLVKTFGLVLYGG